MNKTYSTKPLVVAIALAITSTAIYSNAWAQSRDGGEIVFGVPAGLISPTDMIRYKVSVDTTQGGNLYDSLYRAKSDGSVIPWLAEETVISPDGLKWTLKLRKGVKFHDGTPFNAEAVKWNLETRQREKLFQLSSQLKPITAVNVIDEATVELVLSQPVASLMVALSSPAFGIQSPTAYTKFPSPADYAVNAAGTGPFKLSKLRGTSSQLEMVRNEDYWAGKPPLQKLTFQAIPDAASRIASLESGDIQYASVPMNDVQRLSKGGAVKIQLTERNVSVHYAHLNTKDKLLADVRVRRALAYAMNQADLAKLMFGVGQPADSFVPSSVVGYSSGTPYPYDPQKAKQLLAEASVPAGTKLKVMTFPNGPHVNFAQLMKQQWDAVGLSVTIDVRDLAGFVSTITGSDDWHVGISTSPPHYADAEAIYFRFLASGAPSNWPRYSNPEVDRLLVQQQQTLDPAGRQKLLDRIQELVFADMPLIPFSTYRSPMGAAPGLNGVEAVALSTIYFDKAWLKK